jgi:hypothetical protein
MPSGQKINDDKPATILTELGQIHGRVTEIGKRLDVHVVRNNVTWIVGARKIKGSWNS